MKILSLSRLATLAIAATLVLGGCSNPSKKHPGSGDSGDLVDPNLPGGTDALSPNGIPAGERPPNIDPNADVDYSVLSSETIYFDYDSTVVKGSERGKLQKIADYLKDNPGKRLMLAGHTDVRGTPEYNRGLGERRAQTVREYLAGLGVAPGSLFTISYGSEKPAVDAANEDAYSKNRRVAPGVITK
ncbi:Outer membrane protein OmpA [Verrucomicrobium sp. GAS474]|uniref:OmpA family protein n=1 Tax=Verrucomicrobium sp. GAS474 TaxID=1882831 RepID=UPI000879F3D6|nr:OmpA family protein [Verrucomicrobium sp. GAS474]SDT98333.1 Outer membrane protein OmpA [Verrucomicrobium sp. GAS474]